MWSGQEIPKMETVIVVLGYYKIIQLICLVAVIFHDV